MRSPQEQPPRPDLARMADITFLRVVPIGCLAATAELNLLGPAPPILYSLGVAVLSLALFDIGGQRIRARRQTWERNQQVVPPGHPEYLE